MIDRTKSPQPAPFQAFELPPYRLEPLTKQLKLLTLNDPSPTAQTISLSFMFDRGFVGDRATFACTDLLMESLIGSCAAFSKETLYEKLRECSTQLFGFGSNDDTLVLTMRCANPDSFQQVLPLVKHLLSTPAFKAEEIDLLKKQKKQILKNLSMIPDIVASREMNDLLFEEGHPYSFYLKEADLAYVTPQTLRETFETRGWYPGLILLTGPIQADMIEAVKDQCTDLPAQPLPPVDFPKVVPKQPAAKRQIDFPDSPQSILKLASVTISADHPDTDALTLLCYLLGGPSMGSILMERIRKKNGHTYGIYAHILRTVHASLIMISAAVKKGTIEETKQAIYEEIKRLQTTPLSEAQVGLLKRSYQGYAHELLDNTYTVGSLLASMYRRGIPFERWAQVYEKAGRITALELQMVAQKYLTPENLSEVIINA